MICTFYRYLNRRIILPLTSHTTTCNLLQVDMDHFKKKVFITQFADFSVNLQDTQEVESTSLTFFPIADYTVCLAIQ